MNDQHKPFRKTAFILLAASHIAYLALSIFVYPLISPFSIFLAFILIFFSSMAYGKACGFFSGLFLMLASAACFVLNENPALFLQANDIRALLFRSEVIAALAYPMIGLLAGFYTERFGLKNKSDETRMLNLQRANIALENHLHDYEKQFADLAQNKVYRHSWDAWIDNSDLNGQIVSAALAIVTGSPLRPRITKDIYNLLLDPSNNPNSVLFDLLTQIKPDLVAVLQPDGTIIQYNKKIMAIYGYSARTSLDRANIVQFLTADAARLAESNISHILRPDFDSKAIYVIGSSDNGFSQLAIPAQITLTCVGSPVSLVASVACHTSPEPDHQAANLAVFAKRNICCLSSDRTITYINSAVADILGCSDQNLLGERFDKLISHRHLSRFDEFIKSLSDGRKAACELNMQPANGNQAVLRLDAFPSLGQTGCFIGVVLLVDDITSLKHSEEALQHRLYIEKLISSVSTRFIFIKSDEFENEIIGVLKKVCQLEEANECSIEIIQSRRIKNQITYRAKNEMNARHASLFNSASTDDHYETISIPLVVETELMGSLQFYQEKYRNSWLDADLELIKMIGEIIINAMIRKENELNIRLNEYRLSTTLHSIGDAVIATDINGNITLMNRIAELLTGWSNQEALHKPLATVFLPVEEQPDPADAQTDGRPPQSLDHESSLVLKSRDGSLFYIAFSQTRIEDQAKEIFGDVTIFRDITKEKQENDEIRYISYHDKLTGLYNRAFFEEELARLNTRRQYPITLILGDCNGLKIANDIFGHLEGDKLLQALARILKQATRHEDIVARWGGDEFAIIMPKTDELAAASIRERILSLCTSAAANPIQPSLALGSATYDVESDNLVELLKIAEDRMYRHKLMEGRSARNALLRSIEKMIYEKSFETEEHANRIAEMSQIVGREIGLTDYELEELSLLSSLHDIGKIGIPDKILMKPSQLSDEEWQIMKEHSEKGCNLAKSTPELNSIADSILHHHEHWDGSGYPSGLRGEKIPKLSRILSIIDAYDVITHSRSYKEAQSNDEALAEIARCAGTQFDPELTRIFVRLMRELGYNRNKKEGSE